MNGSYNICFKEVQSGVPVGCIIIFKLGFVPPNFLPCNGAMVSKKKFPDLYKVIGNKFGSSTTTLFCLPNLFPSDSLVYQPWWDNRPCVLCKQIFLNHDNRNAWWWCKIKMQNESETVINAYKPMSNIEFLEWRYNQCTGQKNAIVQ